MALVVLTALAVPAAPQYDFNDEPLLASALSDQNIEMRGRWVRQWVDDNGTLVLMYNGGFRLDMGKRRLAANNAIVWIARSTDAAGRKYFDLTVYLSENAEVLEPAGTLTTDNVLLVRGLRTAGQIIKYEDAHAPESMEQSPLYLQALRERSAMESAAASQPVVSPEVVHPGAAPEAPKPTRAVRYRAGSIEPAETPEGEKVFVAGGGVYFSQEGGSEAAMLEIRAENAVIFPAGEAASALLGAAGAPKAGTEHPVAESAPASNEEPSKPAPESQPAPEDQGLLGLSGAAAAARNIHAVYLEGDVVLSLGNRFIRANRLYYDFERGRALILDGVFRADIPQREIPLYVRADEIRQLSAREFSADHAVVTTSEFYTPSYHVGAEHIYLRDTTPRDERGRATAPTRGTYEMRNTTLNIEGVPVAWWPYSQGTLESSETTLKSFSTGYMKRRGYAVETRWQLFNLLNVATPPGFDPTLRIDYFSKRGPAVGVNLDYQRDNYYGLLRTYFVYDTGKDNLGPLRKNEEEPPSPERGRALWRHRQYLDDGWELTLQAAYVSDKHFLEEWERAEYREGQEQETLMYLKRAKDVEAITLLANWRMLDWLTQTEHLPELAYRRIGDTWLDPVILYHESRVGAVRYMPEDFTVKDLPYDLYQQKFSHAPFIGHNVKPTPTEFRGDVREEAELPLKLGAFNLVPFASVRGTYWSSQPLDDGGLWRGLGVYGVRGSTMFSRTYDDINSDLLDIHRIRHIIQPEFATWWANSDTRSELITPYDYGVETIDAVYGFTGGVRQTWQTKRGPSGQQRTVDLATLNLQLGMFGNTDGRHDTSNGFANPLRPEDSRTRNYFAGDFSYRISDSTSLLYDFNIDANDRVSDMQNISLAIERDPRVSYVIGERFSSDVNLNYFGGGWNYKLNEKHSTAARIWFDLETGRVGEMTLSYVRKLQRWYFGLNFTYDKADSDYSISVSFWPEGVPEWTVGSRRFTGLGTSTGIRP